MSLSELTDPAAVYNALGEYRAVGRSAFLAKYGFGQARTYWLVDRGERFDSKAIVGAAFGFQHPEHGPLGPADFSGGEDTVARKLRELGFIVESAAGLPHPTFEIGRAYKRRQLLSQWGGQYQNGIATPAGRPYLLVFTGGGEGYGYSDGWAGDGSFRYFGEGQVGDMRFDGGNRALRDHAADGKALHLFERKKKKGPNVEYRGEFACGSYERTTAPDRNAQQRSAIVFHLVPISNVDTETTRNGGEQLSGRSLNELRRLALSAASAPEAGAKEGTRTYYARAACVRDYVLARSGGQCELCHQEAPFERLDGTPYLEPHHTRRLSDGGPDHPRWVAAICPNCHRRIHYGRDGHALNDKLQGLLGQREDGR